MTIPSSYMFIRDMFGLSSENIEVLVGTGKVSINRDTYTYTYKLHKTFTTQTVTRFFDGKFVKSFHVKASFI